MPKLKELWRPAKNYEDKYEVSNIARFRSIKTGLILKPLLTGSKYYYFILTNEKKGKREKVFLHRLVAFHWVANPYLHNEVNHIDGDKLNCQPENLEWVSKSENSRHAVRIGLHRPKFMDGSTKGEGNVNAKLSWINVNEIRERWKNGDTDLSQMADQYGVKYKTLWEVVHNKSWKAA